MKAFPFTPLAVRHNDGAIWIEDANGLTLFEGNPLLSDGQNGRQLLSVARLLASAPDLLESLREVNSMLFHVDGIDADHPALVRAREVITAATRNPETA